MDISNKFLRWVNGTPFASQIYLNIVLGFTTLYSTENAFFLKNQGKGVFLFRRDEHREIRERLKKIQEQGEMGNR